MVLYVILEVLLYLVIVFCKIFAYKEWILNVLTFLPIILTSMVVTIHVRKNNSEVKPLYLMVMLATLGDLCFIYLDNIYGIYFFFLIQLCLMYYLNSEKLRILYLVFLGILIFAMCFLLNGCYLIIEGILYIMIFLFNLVTMVRRLKSDKWLLLLFTGFVFLSICDFNVMLIYFIKIVEVNYFFENICFIIEWFFYIGFQIMIALYIVGIIKKMEIIIKR